MNLLQITVLALIQGITEFLPISSSGHLILVPALTGGPDQGVVTDMVTHLGTLLAVVVYFWSDTRAMGRGLTGVLGRKESNADSRLLLNVLIGTVPIFVAGLIMKAVHLDEMIRSTVLVACNAIVFGVLLYVFDAFGLVRRTVADMNWKTSLVIGCAQALSLSPGTSRSGVTMTAARALGFGRTDAARFSFLLSIPANGAAAVFVIADAIQSGGTITGAVILTGVLTFFIALGTITLLMRMVRHVSFLPFAVYRVALGVFLLAMIYWGMPLGAVN